MKKGIVAALMAGAMGLAVMVPHLFAGPLGPAWGGSPLGRELGVLEVFLDLKLTEAQQAGLRETIARYRPQREAMAATLRESGNKVAAVLQADTFSEEEARKAFRAASSVREERFVLGARMLQDLKALLTPDQRKLLQERRAERHERMRHLVEGWLEGTGTP